MKYSLKSLIYASIGITLLAAFIPSLKPFLFFSKEGIKHFFFWQLISYPLVEKGPISFSFFLSLGFNMYLLWVFGSSLIERAGRQLFFFLYFGASLFGALATLFLPQAVLAGSQNSVYAIMIAWMLLNSHSQLLLFFALPISSKWLILALTGISLVTYLANALWAEGISLLVSCLFSYFFTLLVFKKQSPFSFLYRFEKKFLSFFEKRKAGEKYQHSKIYDIKSGKPVLDDEQFMDAMLDRISRHGEDSLTSEEKKRMQDISSKKRNSEHI